jgi:hypothetical protein
MAGLPEDEAMHELTHVRERDDQVGENAVQVDNAEQT